MSSVSFEEVSAVNVDFLMCRLKRMPKAKSKTHNVQEPDPDLCVFCGDSDDVEETYGKKIRKCNLTVHYFCMLFSSGLCQRGRKDTQGILGFLPEDIKKEVRRGFRLRCCFCKKKGATIGCIVKSCRKAFHLGCGQKNGTLHQFFDTFSSYCENHRPRQTNQVSDRLAFYGTAKTTCAICMHAVQARASNETLRSPCCKGAWFHRLCIQRYSISAGLYYFKCPLCNNREKFQAEMLHFGIFIPDQDAAWELENNAFNALLERYSHCDAVDCLCSQGRDYDKADTKWEIIICEWCGSKGCHLKCEYLVYCRDDWVCPDCFELDGREKSGHNKSSSKKTVKKCTPVKKMSKKDIDEHLKEKAKQLHSPTSSQATSSSDPACYSTPTLRKRSTPQRKPVTYSLRNQSRMEYLNTNTDNFSVSESNEEVIISDDSGTSSSDYTEIINVVVETCLPDDETSSFNTSISPPSLRPVGFSSTSSTEDSDGLQMLSDSQDPSKKSRKRKRRRFKQWSRGIIKKPKTDRHNTSSSSGPPALDPVYETVSETSSVVSELDNCMPAVIKSEDFSSENEYGKNFSSTDDDSLCEKDVKPHRTELSRNIFDSLMNSDSSGSSKSKYKHKKYNKKIHSVSPHQTTLERFLQSPKVQPQNEQSDSIKPKVHEIAPQIDDDDISDVEITSTRTRKLKIKWGGQEIYLKRKLKSKPFSLSTSCTIDNSHDMEDASKIIRSPVSKTFSKLDDKLSCMDELHSSDCAANINSSPQNYSAKTEPFDAISISSDGGSVISISSSSSKASVYETNGQRSSNLKCTDAPTDIKSSPPNDSGDSHFTASLELADALADNKPLPPKDSADIQSDEAPGEIIFALVQDNGHLDTAADLESVEVDSSGGGNARLSTHPTTEKTDEIIFVPANEDNNSLITADLQSTEAHSTNRSYTPLRASPVIEKPTSEIIFIQSNNNLHCTANRDNVEASIDLVTEKASDEIIFVPSNGSGDLPFIANPEDAEAHSSGSGSSHHATPLVTEKEPEVIISIPSNGNDKIHCAANLVCADALTDIKPSPSNVTGDSPFTTKLESVVVPVEIEPSSPNDVDYSHFAADRVTDVAPTDIKPSISKDGGNSHFTVYLESSDSSADIKPSPPSVIGDSHFTANLQSADVPADINPSPPNDSGYSHFTANLELADAPSDFKPSPHNDSGDSHFTVNLESADINKPSPSNGKDDSHFTANLKTNEAPAYIKPSPSSSSSNSVNLERVDTPTAIEPSASSLNNDSYLTANCESADTPTDINFSNSNDGCDSHFTANLESADIPTDITPTPTNDRDDSQLNDHPVAGKVADKIELSPSNKQDNSHFTVDLESVEVSCGIKDSSDADGKLHFTADLEAPDDVGPHSGCDDSHFTAGPVSAKASNEIGPLSSNSHHSDSHFTTDVESAESPDKIELTPTSDQGDIHNAVERVKSPDNITLESNFDGEILMKNTGEMQSTNSEKQSRQLSPTCPPQEQVTAVKNEADGKCSDSQLDSDYLAFASQQSEAEIATSTVPSDNMTLLTSEPMQPIQITDVSGLEQGPSDSLETDSRECKNAGNEEENLAQDLQS